ncbi:LysR family transcriptional regulator [Paraburkholderia sp. 1N]|uniref:LysR family transcriptional regulator n=1 Tax=Paraburkholderia solitsugae TaxID=2675748 RepID=A0ABX2BNT3_9BURK|nr:LysR substrate-binding domain-containing protein [Paraburkholderia solitsugae]NPT41483.1 LysR family transcriptional regulator [Paraburkholderia solitsugae]
MLRSLFDLDLRLVRIFLAVADAGGVTIAQAKLNISQPTISSQLSTLETRLGYRLCERGRSGFRLTDQGERFRALCRTFLTTVDEFSAAARHMEKALASTLKIGLIGHTPISQNARISDAISLFRQRDEAVHFSISVKPPGELEEHLLSGAIEIAIGHFWHRVPTLDYTPLFNERQLAYCGRGHPLFARAGRLQPAEVADFDWAWRSYPLPEAQLPATSGHMTAQADNMEAVSLLVLSGCHLGYLPEHFAAPYVAQGLLAALNPQQLGYEVTFLMVTQKQTGRRPIVDAFIEDLKRAHMDLGHGHARGHREFGLVH